MPKTHKNSELWRIALRTADMIEARCLALDDSFIPTLNRESAADEIMEAMAQAILFRDQEGG